MDSVDLTVASFEYMARETYNTAEKNLLANYVHNL